MDRRAHDPQTPARRQTARPRGWRRLGLTTVAIALLLPVAACGGTKNSSKKGGSSGGGTITLKLGHDSPMNHPYQVGAELFKKEVEANTNGRVKVKIFPNAQLGDEGTMLNGLKVGSVDVLFTSTQPISQSVQEVELFALPFIFRDVDTALKVANGSVGKGLAEKIEPAVGGKILGWGTLGERDMWNSKRPIHSPADVRGLKMRIQSSKIQEATYKAFGGLPTPVPFTDLFTSLQTHVVDGADPGPVDIEALKFYQVAKYLTLTRHFLEMVPLIISQKTFDKLSQSDKVAVTKAGKDAVDAEIQALKSAQDTSLATIKSKGMQVVDLTDAERQAFIDKANPVYDQFASQIGGRAKIDEVLAAGK